MNEKSIILLFGRICSGKSSYLPNHKRIITSDVVRSIVKDPAGTRIAIQDTISLHDHIAHCLLGLIELTEMLDDYPIIVDGIRQIEIVEKILEVYPQAELVWLEVPLEERKRRYESRKDNKDTQSFEQADSAPIELECQKIYDKYKNKLTIIHNYEH